MPLGTDQLLGLPRRLSGAAMAALAPLRTLFAPAAVEPLLASDSCVDGAPAGGFRWEADMAAPVAQALPCLVPGLRAPGAIVAEVPAAVGVVDLLAVRFDADALDARNRAGLGPIVLPLRVRVLHALLEGARTVEDLAAAVGTRPSALTRSTLTPLAELGAIELASGVAAPTGAWSPAGAWVAAIELKRGKWRDALEQADNFARSADESWVVLDAFRAGPARSRVDEFAERGLGLALIDTDGRLEVLVRPRNPGARGWLHALIAERALAAVGAAPAKPPAGAPGPRTRPVSETRTVARV